MTTVALEKRVRTLEAEVKSLKSVVRESVQADLRAKIIEGLNSGPAVNIDSGLWKRKDKRIKAKVKKLPAGLKQALREVKEGKLVGPFHSVEAFMADLKR